MAEQVYQVHVELEPCPEQALQASMSQEVQVVEHEVGELAQPANLVTVMQHKET